MGERGLCTPGRARAIVSTVTCPAPIILASLNARRDRLSAFQLRFMTGAQSALDPCHAQNTHAFQRIISTSFLHKMGVNVYQFTPCRIPVRMWGRLCIGSRSLLSTSKCVSPGSNCCACRHASLMPTMHSDVQRHAHWINRFPSPLGLTWALSGISQRPYLPSERATIKSW